MITDYMHGELEAYCMTRPRDRNAMFWGCVTYSGVGTLVPISGNMNSESEKYIGTLDQNLCPSCFAKC